ncbi:YfhO family protein [Candidatus Hydrogenedentota bacterium]
MLILFFAHALRPGYLFSGADVLLAFPPFIGDGALEEQTAANYELWDIVVVFKPWARFTEKWARTGILPWWIPNVGCGVPFVGNFQSALFSPLNWPTFIMPACFSYLLRSMLVLWMAGAGMFYFLRKNRVSPAAAAFGAIAWTFCPKQVQFVQWTMAIVFVWLPFMLISAQNLVVAPSARRFALFVILLACSIAGGHPETMAVCWPMVALWAVIVAVKERFGTDKETDVRTANKNFRRSILLFVLGTVVACCLMSVQIFPFLDYLDQSVTKETKLLGGNDVMSPYLPKVTLLSSLCPSVFGMIPEDTYWGFSLSSDPYLGWHDVQSYIGVSASLLILIALLRRDRWTPLSIFLVLCVAIGIFTGYGLPPIRKLTPMIPFFSGFRHSISMLVCMPGLAGLSALGLDALLSKDQLNDRQRQLIFRVLLVLGTGVLVLSISWTLMPVGSKQLLERFIDSNMHLKENQENYSGYLWISRNWEQTLTRIYSNVRLDMWIWVTTVSWFVFLMCRRRKRAVVIAITSLLLLIDLGRLTWPCNVSIPAEKAYPDFAGLEELQDQAGKKRLLTIPWALEANLSAWYGFDAVGNYDCLGLTNSHTYLGWAGAFDASWRSSPERRRLMNIANVGYFMTDSQPPDTELISQWLYRNPDALPRCYMVSSASTVRTNEDALRMLMSPDFHPRETVLLTGSERISRAYGGSMSAEIVEYGPNRVQIQTQTEEGGILVLSDAFARGWHASIDEAQVPIHRGNVMFRVVEVPPGKRTVEFKYLPKSVLAGAAISVLTMLGLLLCVLRISRWPQPERPS